MGERGGKRAETRADEDLSVAESASFEAAMARLEVLVERLEAGELALEDALALFEEGVSLTRECGQRLDRAERRVEELVQQGGDWSARPLDAAAARGENED